ncbi:hypothetical protein H106_01359 [Trichophyton rubrum CBS 735.88]|nr:hypothetical protein H106_01359 [Trichophyton rubrum CBS 735.88]
MHTSADPVSGSLFWPEKNPSVKLAHNPLDNNDSITSQDLELEARTLKISQLFIGGQQDVLGVAITFSSAPLHHWVEELAKGCRSHLIQILRSTDSLSGIGHTT